MGIFLKAEFKILNFPKIDRDQACFKTVCELINSEDWIVWQNATLTAIYEFWLNVDDDESLERVEILAKLQEAAWWIDQYESGTENQDDEETDSGDEG